MCEGGEGQKNDWVLKMRDYHSLGFGVEIRSWIDQFDPMMIMMKNSFLFLVWRKKERKN